MEYMHILDSFMNGNFSQMVEQIQILGDYDRHSMLQELDNYGYSAEALKIITLYFKILGQR